MSRSARLIYSAIMSLDGYMADEEGRFDWAVPDDEVHAFINDRERGVGTFLLGRRMYETMAVWETAHTWPDSTQITLDFAELWQRAEKIVFSRTLNDVSTAKTTLRRRFDPAYIRELKARSPHDLSIGGASLAAHAFPDGLIDVCELYLVPIIIGAGKRALPESIQLQLELTAEERFDGGMMYLRYDVLSTTEKERPDASAVE